MVLADGRIVIVSENEYPGGSPFAISPPTMPEYLKRFMVGSSWSGPRLWNCNAIQSTRVPHPCRLCWQPYLVSNVLLPYLLVQALTFDSRFNRATAPSLIKHFRDCVKGAPRELYANVLLTAGPAGKDSLVVVQMCYLGSREQGQEYLAAISSWDGESCLLNEVDEKSFLHQQDSVAQVLRGKRWCRLFQMKPVSG